jgi:hypothetical protein
VNHLQLGARETQTTGSRVFPEISTSAFRDLGFIEKVSTTFHILNVSEWDSHSAGTLGFTFESQRGLSGRLHTLFFDDLGELGEGGIETLVFNTSRTNVVLLHQIVPHTP